MKRITSFFLLLMMIIGCNQQIEQTNPLLMEFDSPHGVPPFDQIRASHFEPAFESAIQEYQREIQRIATSAEASTFTNTIEAIEYSGELLNQVESVFYNIKLSHTNDTLRELAKEIGPRLSQVYDQVYLNDSLFARVKKVYDNTTSQDLDGEQFRLLNETYKKFIRKGALLAGENKTRLKEINQRLAKLEETFADNLLNETNNFSMVIKDESNLSGLPLSLRSAAKEKAESMEMSNSWVFTLQKPSMIPFLQYADNRELRKEIYTAYINRGNNNNEYDNKDIAKEMVNLRLERANLLGFESHAHYVLDDNVAKTPENVYKFMDQLMTRAVPVAKNEAQRQQEMIEAEGKNYKLQPWDWWYYTEKIRQKKYDLNEKELRSYFQLANVRDGAFMVINKLWGLQFEPRDDISVYHEDVEVYEVLDSDKKHVGILYMDFFPRESKRGGAWMSSFRKQYVINDEYHTPIVTNNFNFTPPSGKTPSLISLDEVKTLFHELGHGLHGLLSNCQYKSLSGTSVSRDFVEFPSQIMENWATEPTVMKDYAIHFKTGETIPDELIEKMAETNLFNQGFITTEYMAASYLDMDLHSITAPLEDDIMAFEDQSLINCGLIPEIEARYRIPYFAHIFASGYSAGYYSYIWSEIMVADAYQEFKEKGLFNQEVAQSFKENILSRGGTKDPMKLYIQFKGSEPSVRPLLESRGLLTD
ncbi:MAG: peptidase M3 [Bacteroidetes bacterium]|jgi:peptidyl-dipeptidase Dcp|nr:peptidase M3 [Bacteroidota bacterium]